ncbi:hypothetical protein A7981_08440 [Methylovorus sp. MM2]|uniref:PIN-like domain-containing protein n=1 Tax=Methylovorus sp. MM2 TaxID=1848038 RepID=UPI0007E20449|nr:PIN-like domain-containing protein [Methylovorus sp. MM2]OAM51509.1 hypothetical protein A7981_08440 [Methylovorus sp. MM2]
MRSIFIGHFRPTNDEFNILWNEAIFAIDANVLLNLYRYSINTRQELEKALTSVKEKAFITHQAAREFLKNRSTVTAGQASEYTKAIKTINDLLANLSSNDRHPFLPDSDLPAFAKYSQDLVKTLENQQHTLLQKLTDDEVLDFAETLFEGKTGGPFSNTKLDEIAKLGDIRYQNEVPPGYKDGKKDGVDDPYRKYGDLILWLQIIEQAKSLGKPVIFITDDKKEDWWTEQSGRTIGPRPELIEEFHKETKQKFWMYTVDKFIQESARISKSEVSDDVIAEIIQVSLHTKIDTFDKSHIEVSQEVLDSEKDEQTGFLNVHLTGPMKYATGTGKFLPAFASIPKFSIDLINSPYSDNSVIGVSSGCGTPMNFNVHMKSKHGLLEEGDYLFMYTAVLKNAELG